LKRLKAELCYHQLWLWQCGDIF